VKRQHIKPSINPLNAQLNPICHMLALLGAHHILHISRVRVNDICFSHYYFTSLISLAFMQSEVTALLGNHLLQFPTQTILLLTPSLILQFVYASSFYMHVTLSFILLQILCPSFSSQYFPLCRAPVV